MQFLLLPDSFKGSLTAKEVAQIMQDSITAFLPKSNCMAFPFSDGGEGALDTLQQKALGQLVPCETVDALNRPIQKSYFKFSQEATAWIELSQSAGLVNLQKAERNPLKTTTLGVGWQIKHALDQGCTKIIVGIGGSATHDLGAGIFVALGGKLRTASGASLFPSGEQLGKLSKVDKTTLDPRLNKVTLQIACDVQNPLLGRNGAAHVYAPQKGATPKIVKILEANGAHFIKQLEHAENLATLPGGGAAGGVAAGLKGLLGANWQSGFDLLAKKTGLDEALQKANIVFSGEGRFDSQSAQGKLPFKIAQRAARQNIPTYIFAGTTAKPLDYMNLPKGTRVFDCTPDHQSTEEAMANAKENLVNQLKIALNTLKTS